jgi:ketosteroid isomerase-like protein
MNSSQSVLTALKFNDKINQQDLEGLVELMTEDHTFIDNDGAVTKGKDAMKDGWRNFFQRYPDYRNIFTCVTVQDNVVVMIGYSDCADKLLAGPSIWTAKIRGGLVSEWRVYWLDKR